MKRESYTQLNKHERPFCSDKYKDLTCPPINKYSNFKCVQVQEIYKNMEPVNLICLFPTHITKIELYLK